MRITLIANPDNLHVRRWIDFLAGRGHALTLIADPFTTARPAGCEAILVPQWNLLTNILAFRLTPRPYGNNFWKFLHVRPLVRASRPDVVHGFEPYNNGLATAWAGPYPRVLTPMGLDVHKYAFESRIAHFMVARALRGVDMISTNDETMADYLERTFGIARAKVRAFTWGVDLDVFRPGLDEAAARWRRELEIPEGAPVVLSPRNFQKTWGLDLLLDAAPAVLRERPETVFVFLRGAAGDAEFMRAARGRDWAGSARFIERFLNEPELAGLFAMADCFVSVPESDLLAQTILEGMACGCLPVLADHAPYRKHARPGENAVILEEYSAAGVAKAVIEALGNENLKENARREGPARMREHENWKTNALKMEDVYAEAQARFKERSQ